MTDTTETPEGIEDDASWYAENNARFWRTLYRLRAYCAESGPIPLPSGKVVGYYADGFSWDAAAVAQLFPTLVAETEASIIGTKTDIERALSVVLEEVPGLRIGAVKYTLDKDATTGMLRAAPEKMQPLRVAKTKLGIR